MTKPGPEPSLMIEAIIEFTADRIAHCVRKSRLKKEISIIYHGELKDEDDMPTGQPKQLIGNSSFERLCTAARKMLHERSVMGSKVSRQESIGFYESIVADPTIPYNYKLKARERLDLIQQVTTPEASIPLSGSFSHQIIDIDKLGLTLDEKKELLKESRASNS